MASDTIPEILTKIGNLSSYKDRVSALRNACLQNPALTKCIKFCYRSDIIWDLPEGVPPYNPLLLPDEWGYNRLPSEVRKFQYFVTGNGLRSVKREQMFIELLESVSKEEAEFILQVKDGDIKIKNITKKLAVEAFPDIFANDPEVNKDGKNS